MNGALKTMGKGYRPPGVCPVCRLGLTITNLTCDGCKTTITGTFKPCKFCQLTPEMYKFLLIFLKCRGNIREVEKELSISYPTVRSRLDGLLDTLGLHEDEVTVLKEKRRQVLGEVRMGKLTSEEALELLQKQNRKRGES